MIRTLSNWWRDENGAIAPFLALLMIPILGMVALGGEVSGWYMKQRQLQNVADSAALAAAADNSSKYANEVAGVVHAYGWDNDASGDFTVTATNSATCPTTGTATCYKVTLEQKVPLYLTQIVGYTGNGTNSSGRMATRVAAFAIASAGRIDNYCLIGLGPSSGGNPTLKLTGSTSDFSSCDARANGTIQCASSIQFGYLFAPDTTACNNSPGKITASGYDGFFKLRDFSSKIAPYISSGCNPTDLSQPDLPTTIYICSGNSVLSGNLNITKPNTKVFVYNTTLDLNSHVFQTTSTGSATVIFTGNSTTNLPTWVTDTSKAGNGTFTVKGASAGDFADMALIADPKYTSTLPFAPAQKLGMTINLLGGVYAPKTDIQFPSNTYSTIGGLTCISIEAWTIQAVGGKLGNIAADCVAAGYTGLPTVVVGRNSLVG